MLKLTHLCCFCLSLGIASSTAVTNAQEYHKAKRHKELQDYDDFQKSVKGGQVRPNWMADGNSFWYSESPATGTVIWKVDPVANTKERLFDVDRLRNSIQEVLGHEPSKAGLPFDDFEFEGPEEQVVRFAVDNEDLLLRLTDYKVTKVSAATDVPAEQPSLRGGRSRGGKEVLSPDGKWLAGISNYNVYVRNVQEGQQVPLTDDGGKDDAWGGNYFLRQRLEWSPDSSRIAAVKVDFREVPRIPLTRYLSAKQEVEWWPYPGARDIGPRTKLFTIDIESTKKVPVDIGGQPEQRITILGWRSDSLELFLRRTSRYGKDRRFLAARAADGTVREILNETQFGKIRDLRMFEDGQRFICVSETKPLEGEQFTNNIDLFSLDGTHICRIAERLAGWVALVDVQEELNRVYFTTSPYWRSRGNLHCADLQGNKCIVLDETPGVHEFVFSPSKEFYLDTVSSPSSPPVTRFHRDDGTLLQNVSRVDIDAAAETFHWQRPESFVVRADDGVLVHGVLYKPFDFDSTKKYPVVSDRFAWFNFPNTFRSGNASRLAQLGFIVVRVQARFTPGKVGLNEINDHVSALKQLAQERPYMDLGRVGIVGGSYSGYMVLHAMLRRPDFYRVGVAGAPISDMAEHNGNEILVGDPDEDKEAYEFVSNRRRAANLSGKLLIIHGTSDSQVPFFHTMRLLDAFRKAGKTCDLLVIPDGHHGARGIYDGDHIDQYLVEHLRP